MNPISQTFICLTEEEQAAASQGELAVEAMKRKEEDYVGQDVKRVWIKTFFVGLEIEKKSSEFVSGVRCQRAFVGARGWGRWVVGSVQVAERARVAVA